LVSPRGRRRPSRVGQPGLPGLSRLFGLDTTGKPYAADFGLALREEDYGREAGFAGTPA